MQQERAFLVKYLDSVCQDPRTVRFGRVLFDWASASASASVANYRECGATCAATVLCGDISIFDIAPSFGVGAGDLSRWYFAMERTLPEFGITAVRASYIGGVGSAPY